MDSVVGTSPTVGVELEWHLIDARSLLLADAVLDVLAAFRGDPHVKPELLQCALEVTSPPADSVSDLRAPLLARLLAVRARCDELGVRLVGGATTGLPSGLRRVTPTERYLRVSDTGMFLSQRLQATCALHVHVGMPSGDAAIALTERARGVLPALLALSSSSPFWDGFDTGFASFRHRLLAMTPNYGAPPRLSSVADLERVMEAGRRAGILESYRDVHWDLRPRPDFGTLELRVFDAQPTLSASLSLAALAHALFTALLREDVALDEYLIPPLPPWMERENAFRASRFGLDACLFVDESGDTRGVREVLVGVLSALAPTAVELGEGAELEGAIDLLLEGSWADRARRLLSRHGSLSRVTAALADALDEDLLAGSQIHPHVYTRDARELR